jgi:hypothetical protein
LVKPLKILLLRRRYEVSSGFRISLRDIAEPSELIDDRGNSLKDRGTKPGRGLRSIWVGINDQNPDSAVRQRARAAGTE